MNQKKKISRKVISYVLALVMVFSIMTGIVPGTSMTAQAADYTSLKNTTTVVNFDGKQWYLIDYDNTTVTLLSKECVAASVYDSSGSYVEYGSSTVKGVVDNWYKDNNNISAEAKTAVVNGMFLLTLAQAQAITNENVRKCPIYQGVNGAAWWLCSRNSSMEGYVCCVSTDGLLGFGNPLTYYGSRANDKLGVRPALKLDLRKVTFNSNTFTPFVNITGISLNQTTATINVPNTVTLTATVTPSNASNKTVTWSSSNTDIATVNNNGVVTAVSPGTATITARATNGTASTSDDKAATCTVTVNPGQAASAMVRHQSTKPMAMCLSPMN